MAQLSKIISSILRDMVLAQHEANMYAVALENLYKKNGRLEKFSLPAVATGDIELELRYGVNDGSENKEEYEINYHTLRNHTRGLTHQLATVVLDTVLRVMQETIPATNDGADDHVTTLEESPELKEKFCAFLSRKIFQSFQQAFTAIINEDGTFNGKTMLECTVGVSEDEILHHPDLSEMFDRPGGKKAREKALEEMRTAVEDTIPKILKDVNFMRKRLLPSMNVVIDSNELAKLPEECVHTLHFKVSPKNINFYSDDDL